MTELAPSGIPPLRHLYVYVTEGCNCACKHCWIVSAPSPRGKGAFIDPAVLDAAIAEAAPLGLESIKWTGGEPTYHPDFPALLAVQKKHGIGGIMESNGMEITPPLAALMKESGVTHVSVSLDGATAETHDGVRGVKGAFRRSLAGIRSLTDAGFKPQIIMSLLRENVGELEELLRLAGSLGAGSVKLNVIQPTLRGEELHAEGGTLTVPEVVELHRRVGREIQPTVSFPILFDIPLAFRPLGVFLDANGCSICSILTVMGLLANGSYALCGIGENLPDLVFGVAGRGELERIWNGHHVLRRIRNEIPGRLRGICGVCLMKNACLGACIAQNYYRSRDLLAPFWFCELAEKAGIFPAARMGAENGQESAG